MALIKEASAINLNKDIKIENLTKQLKKTSLDPPLKFDAIDSPLKFDAKENGNQTLFSEFDGVFSKQQLKKLRSIPSGKKKDSTFVLACMRFLYPDTNILKNRSVTGRTFKKEKKREMTPTKVKFITKILNERLVSENGLDQFDRLERVNKLMKDAIMKLKPSKQMPIEIEPNDNQVVAAQPIETYPKANYPFGVPAPYINQSTQYASLPIYGQMIDWTNINYQMMPGFTIGLPNTTTSNQPQTEPAEQKYTK